MMNRTMEGWPRGLKRTKQREQVFSALSEAPAPLSAADLYMQIAKGEDSVWLSTIYRILEQLVDKGAVTRFTVTGSDTALYEINRHAHKHYAVCIGCRRIVPMRSCPLESFQPALPEDGFRVTGHNLEIFGYCMDCAPALP